MSLKDNFNQAVRELLKRDGIVGSDGPPPRQNQPSSTPRPPIDGISGVPDIDALFREPLGTSGLDKPLGLGFDSTFDEDESESAVQTEIPTPMPTYTPPTPPPIRAAVPTPPEKPYFETEETTIISRNTIVDGNIRSFANIDIEGSVKGDVQITKNANLSGKIVGDLTCNNAKMQGSSMQGNVVSKGQVAMDKDSLILGDIATQYLDLNGKIKGNVEVGGKAEFKTDAIIFGNINASTITVLDGATIQGFVNTTFLQETASSVFPDQIAVAE